MNVIMIKTIFFFSAVLALFSCSQSHNQHNVSENQTADSLRVYPRYARGFMVEYVNDYKVITVRNPWDTSKTLHQYILLKPNQSRPDTLPLATVVNIPVKRIVTVFAPHVELVQGLGELSSIVGVCEPQYIHNPQIKQNINQNTVVDLGSSFNIDIEKLITVHPDLILVSPFQDNKYGKIVELGVPIAEASCYMEHTPLGRTEWFLFVSYFFGKEQFARHVFDSIADCYKKLQQQTIACKDAKPSIFSEKKFGDVWHIPGGNSYMANLYHDAGAQYVWDGDRSTGSLPLNFETVYARAANADYWCIKDFADSTYTYSDLASEFPAYSDFSAFKNRHIIFCNTQTTAYYETGFLKPDQVLADLIAILHPSLLSNHKNIYFQPLSNNDRK